VIYVRRPTEEEQAKLRRMMRQEVGRVSQRAHMILWSARRRTVPELARTFDVSRATIRFWIRRFDTAGPAGLYDAPRSGRPRKVNEQVAEAMVRMVQNDPRHMGYLATFWRVAMLALALVEMLGVHLSASGVRGALRRLGLRWGRPRQTMPTKVDPQKAQKQWAIARAVIETGPETTILYGDESRVQLLPLIRSMWHWLGQQVRVPTPGTNVTRTLFGALNIHRGRWVYLARKRMAKEDFIAFLEHLLVAYPTGPILLVVDNFSSHTAHAVQVWLSEQSRLRLLYLPTYCSHLNPVERIWLQLKNTIAANRLYGSMKVLLDTIDAFFIAMTPEKALTWTST